MIKIICVGKIKEKYIEDAIAEYCKRLSKYSKLKLIEVNDYNNSDIQKNKSRESEEILKHIDSKDYIIVLDIKGEQLDSVQLSKKINSIFNSNSTITFIIGGSDGLDKKIIDMANYKLSFSKLTFPHQLFRVILLEQIYRTFKINNNESYHK